MVSYLVKTSKVYAVLSVVLHYYQRKRPWRLWSFNNLCAYHFCYCRVDCLSFIYGNSLMVYSSHVSIFILPVSDTPRPLSFSIVIVFPQNVLDKIFASLSNIIISSRSCFVCIFDDSNVSLGLQSVTSTTMYSYENL